jgi:hypothetical protein
MLINMPAIVFDPTVSVRNTCGLKKSSRWVMYSKFPQLSRGYRANLDKWGLAIENRKQYRSAFDNF